MHFYQFFPSISPSNTSGIKTLTFCKSALILATKFAMRKPPFKRNPYLRDKIRLTDFSLKSRFYCTTRGAPIQAVQWCTNLVAIVDWKTKFIIFCSSFFSCGVILFLFDVNVSVTLTLLNKRFLFWRDKGNHFCCSFAK